ncbi:outer membrane protein assembly factor BamA [bacterium]|nr:outer membrane protein assembly factor BamA [bacterium]MBT3849709.1 outer membrane protein assembly factor BamA [bacterium]MBT4434726.1 outer membrane protein assembly factor BamA [bacterium]MDG2445554.1 outer membrane protein assembly factor BamA [Thermodesulfobacteriota bacterium]
MKKIAILVFILLFIPLSFNSFSDSSNSFIEKKSSRLEELEGKKITKIVFFGNKIILNERVEQIMSVEAGDLYNHEKIKADIKTLYSTQYFYKIDLFAKNINDEVNLSIRFEENPVLASFRIVGNDKISLKDLKAPLRLTEGQITSRKQLEVTKSIVEQYYFYKGFNQVKVTDLILPSGEGKIQYEITIKEGNRGYIKGITLVGVDDSFKKELLKSIDTKVKWVWSPITGRGRLSIDLVEMDEQNVKQFFLNKGFVDVKTDKPQIDYIKEKDGYRVTFKVNQGIRYKTGKLSINGDLIKDEKVLLKKLELKESDFFSTGKLTSDIEKLNTIYGDASYAFADINPNVQKNSENKEVNVEFQIEKGEKFKVNSIMISGNTRTRDKVIRREVMVNENDDYSSTKIKRSKGRINRRGYFETVEISERPVENKPNYLDLNVEVEEKPTGFFSIAGGYSSVETLLLGVQVQESNFMGYGKEVTASATVGGISKNFSLSYNDSYFLDTTYQFGANAFRGEYEYQDFDRNSWGGGARVGKAMGLNSFLNFSYRYEDITIDDLTLAANEVFQEGNDKISSLGLGWTYDTRNNFITPSKGIIFYSKVEDSSDFLGSNLYFTKYSSRFAKYHEIKKNHILAYNADAGFIDFRDIGNRIVVSERYFLGGPNNLRGFKSRRVSPRRLLSTARFVRIGGNKYVFNNLEYIFPIALETGLRGLFFVDAGNSYDETQNIDYNPWDMKKDVGFGFRWLSPMGPLKLDFGFPVGKRKSDEDKFEVQFSIGSLF